MTEFFSNNHMFEITNVSLFLINYDYVTLRGSNEKIVYVLYDIDE